MIYKVSVFEDFSHSVRLDELNSMAERADAPPNVEIRCSTLPTGKVRVTMEWTEIRSTVDNK